MNFIGFLFVEKFLEVTKVFFILTNSLISGVKDLVNCFFEESKTVSK